LLHEGFDERKHLVYEPDCVQHVDSFESYPHAFLKIFGELADAIYRQFGPVTESCIILIDKNYVFRRTTVRIEVRLDGHQQQLEDIVQHILGRP